MQNLIDLVNTRLSTKRYGDLYQWMQAFHKLPDASPRTIEFEPELKIGEPYDLDSNQAKVLKASLEGLIPWRKGPMTLFGEYIDTEWRSDWKWQRVEKHLKLKGRKVLDVGCGNGYHMWRALAGKPERVLGIDPSPRFVVQFYMLKKYYSGNIPIDLLPLGIQELPATEDFDTLLSMGVLYHRRSPIDHLLELAGQLRSGGQLLLETLVIEGDEQDVLLPEGRYAKMPNVWFIPSVPALTKWIQRAGFSGVECVDESVTTLEEQRTTDWMRFHSLKDFLDPENEELTYEGYPRPRRAALIATKD